MSKQKVCPNCSFPMAQAVYGMPSPDVFENPKYVVMGCLMDEDPLRHSCSKCGLEIYASGRTEITSPMELGEGSSEDSSSEG